LMSKSGWPAAKGRRPARTPAARRALAPQSSRDEDAPQRRRPRATPQRGGGSHALTHKQRGPWLCAPAARGAVAYERSSAPGAHLEASQALVIGRSRAAAAAAAAMPQHHRRRGRPTALGNKQPPRQQRARLHRRRLAARGCMCTARGCVAGVGGGHSVGGLPVPHRRACLLGCSVP
jgi:hypothetical protein